MTAITTPTISNIVMTISNAANLTKKNRYIYFLRRHTDLYSNTGQVNKKENTNDPYTYRLGETFK